MHVLNFEIKNLDDTALDVQTVCQYEISNYLTDAGLYKFFRIPWADALDTGQFIAGDSRQYPLYFWAASDTVSESIEILVPTDYEPVDLIGEVRLSSPFANYHVKLDYLNGHIKGERTIYYKDSIIEPDEYAEFKAFYSKVISEDNRQILLKKRELEIVQKEP